MEKKTTSKKNISKKNVEKDAEKKTAAKKAPARKTAGRAGKRTSNHTAAALLQKIVVLPGEMVFSELEGDISVSAVMSAVDTGNTILLMIEKDEEERNEENGVVSKNVYEIGMIARVRQVIKLGDGKARALFEGLTRAKINDIKEKKDSFSVEASSLTEKEIGTFTPEENEAMCRSLAGAVQEFLTLNPRVSKSFVNRMKSNATIVELVDFVAANLPLDFENKLMVLQIENIMERYMYLTGVLDNECRVMKLRGELAEKLEEKVDENQRKYVLEEQLRLIRSELGEDTPETEADKYMKLLEELNATEEVKTAIAKEIDRYKNIPSGSSESGIEQAHIETLLNMPWDNASEENNSLENAKEILERDHYGLEKVKDRILEFLAVRNLTEKGQTPIICLIGPPGTGKTSIARSLAEAMGRKYIRISLGGVRDEAEIRGHRKTYIGAMPGVIATGLEHAKAKNPLILLDEIDKVSPEYNGSTSSALLEVLDSEQNKEFRDHYLEIPIDLSDVLFIATANSESMIPAPLLDRMEIIELSGYTENEKFHIAKEHLIKKQYEKNGIKRGNLKISDAALRGMINLYTREAGVRSLERKIGQVCRKAAKQIYEKPDIKINVSMKNLSDFLGKEKYLPEDRAGRNQIGIVRGLAWTAVGGVTLEIEVNIMPGKGELTVTGQIGDVMQESARAGLTYIRSISSELGLKPSFFKEHDIHIHIPEGATPKDGPSAGVTMVTAMTSAITKIPARADVAMTGEITLRGRVLPIGGLKEKILAAKAVGIKTVLVPEKNKRDVEEISEEIKSGMDIRFMKDIREIFDITLTKKFKRGSNGNKKRRA
ncbi:MAG: endopeptidase La [Lachnospiraceae bacterium]|nr:endopeptidase La [Lachnospiraceae bacterium]